MRTPSSGLSYKTKSGSVDPRVARVPEIGENFVVASRI